MGDRWYLAQGRTVTSERLAAQGIHMTKKGTIKKRLKKEWIADIAKELGTEVKGLDKCTIDTLTELLNAIVKSHDDLLKDCPPVYINENGN
jgi:hypothetical protein